MRVKELFAFIEERYYIYERRTMGMPKPWTKDPILQGYRFCNAYRELDTQTKWFAKTWREPNFNHEDLWFASLVFRFVNLNTTADYIGFPIPWKPKHFEAVLKARKASGVKVYSGAYMISTHGVKEPKHSYLASSLTAIWKERKKIRYEAGEALVHFHARLMNQYDVGSFMAGQVIADCKYAGEMTKAPDWWTFAASGPGSKRGLNRVVGLPIDMPCYEETWRLNLKSLKAKIDPMIKEMELPRMHAQDLQNCLCEFDKYERVRLGEGTPKQKYNGGKE